MPFLRRRPMRVEQPPARHRDSGGTGTGRQGPLARRMSIPAPSPGGTAHIAPDSQGFVQLRLHELLNHVPDHSPQVVVQRIGNTPSGRRTPWFIRRRRSVSLVHAVLLLGRLPATVSDW